MKRSASIAVLDAHTGILNINKSRGWTSHDVVARVRRLASQKRVGHAGTLDPLAEGVLPVLLGRATRLADFIQLGRKTYRASVVLGTATATDDAEGSVTAAASVPLLTAAQIADTLARFEGEIQQTPPQFSALKVGGQRAYAVARRGQVVELAARTVQIDRLLLLSWASPQLDLEVTCSKGTYVRALARDLAVALGTVGHLGALTRTRVGPFGLDEALTLDQIEERGVAGALLPASRALPDAAVFTADADQAVRVLNGQALEVPGLYAESVWVYDAIGQLVCLASADGVSLRPRLVLL